MPIIDIQDMHHFDSALRKFKRLREKAGIPTKLRQIEQYEKPTAERKRRRAAAVKRFQKKLMKEREAMEKDRGKF